MKRVLVISYYWPPAGGSGVQRWVKFSKYLPSLGWQPVIYTPQNPEISSVDESLAADIPPQAEILKTPIKEPYGIYRKIMGAHSSTDMKSLTGQGSAAATGGEVNPINGEKKSLKQRISLFIRGNFFIPDPRIWWVRPSVRWLSKYLEEHPVDVIVSTGPPHSMHLIARKLSLATGIPYIPDFRDPWTKMYYFKHLHLTRRSERKHFRLEQEVLDDAATVLALTPFVRRDFAARTKTPVALIPNGFDEDDFAGGSAATDGFFNIVHTGLFAADGNPLQLWDVLADKCADADFRSKLRLRLVGKVDSEIVAALEERGLKDNVVCTGYVDHARAVSEQRSADLLILPLRNDPEYAMILPGKLFEYLAARCPVLGIGQPDGATAEVLAEVSAGSMCWWDDRKGMENAVESAWKRYLEGDRSPVGGDLEKYTRRSQAAQLAELLESVSAGKQTTR